MERFLIFSEVIFDCKKKEHVCSGKVVFVNPRNITFIDSNEGSDDVMVIHFNQGQFVSVFKNEVEDYRDNGGL